MREFVQNGGLKLPPFCVFCGKNPIKKNKEHVLPSWLIQHTGNPNRVVNLGKDWLNHEGSSYRRYAFDQFQFPACTACNHRFSHQEKQVKPVIQKLERLHCIRGCEIELLMSWLDKVRTGLWLGMSLLNKNHMAIHPHFYINDRVDSKDRLLGVFRLNRLNPNQNGLSFGAVDSPIAQLMPSCLLLRINALYFVNISTDSLVSRSLGLPFFTQHRQTGRSPFVAVSLAEGTRRLGKNFGVKGLPTNGLFFGQAIQPTLRSDIDHDIELPEEYSTSYCRKMYCRQGTRTDVFMQVSGTLQNVSSNAPIAWRKFCGSPIVGTQQMIKTAKSLLRIQRDLFASIPPANNADLSEDAGISKALFETIISAQNQLI